MRLRPGWLVTLSAAIVVVSAWLPWLTTQDGHMTAIGGVVGVLPSQLSERLSGFGVGQAIVLLSAVLIVAGAMAARGLSARWASSTALAISVLLLVLTIWYYRLYVYSPVSAGYGLYVGVGTAVVAVILSVWTMLTAWAAANRPT